MSTDAIVMMVVAMLVLWGGLAAALVSLSRRRPDADDTTDTAPDAAPDHTHRDL